MNSTVYSLWVSLVDLGIATDEELDLVTNLNGYTEETLNDVLYIRTGFNTLQQYFGYEED